MVEASESEPFRVEIMGIGVHPRTMDEAAGEVGGWIETGARRYVCVADGHSLIQASRDPALKAVFEDAGLVTTDGMPLVWLSRRSGFPRAERVYGPDLMLELCARSEARGWRHFLYGGTDAVLDGLAGNLRAQFPQLRICGRYAPSFRPLDEAEDRAVVAMIERAAPDIVWVGLGAPKQEKWMAEHRPKLAAPVLIGVGAAFDFHSGAKRQAPLWMRRSGLEWLFRLASEPKRLGRRYAMVVPRFLWLIVRQRLGITRRAG